MGVFILKKIATIEHTHKDCYSQEEIRKASRAIVINQGLVLMIHSSVNGDYKFPGGGRKVFETNIDNLIRETKEETGYDVIRDSIRPFGYIEEIRDSSNNKDAIFKIISEYFLCDIANTKDSPCLEEYEKDFDYQTVFINPRYAIEQNEKLDKNEFPWIEREIIVLNIIDRLIGEKDESTDLLQS